MLARRLAVVAVLLALASSVAAQDPFRKWVAGRMPGLVNLYQELHRNPELSFREKATAARLAKALRATGAKVTERVGGLGVVAVMENGRGPTVLVRADMDALPIGEETGLPYRSKVYVKSKDGRSAGVMHACGHDIHMTNLVGTARYLADHRKRWSGRVVFIGQPAEERGAGAKAMLEDKLYERFGKPNYALALHVTDDLESGKVAVKAGPLMANVDSVDITMFGRGGHGAKPHTTIDPIVQAAQLVLQLQTIVSREVDPKEPAVITVGAIQGGTKHNIIPGQCQLQLTVRSYSDAVRKQLREAIVRKAKAVAKGARAKEAKVVFSEGVPVLVNDARLVGRVTRAMRRTLGKNNVVRAKQVMTAEDFARYGKGGVPLCMFRLGSVAPKRMQTLRSQGKRPPLLHSSAYYPDPEPTLRTGIRAMVAAVLDLMPRRKPKPQKASAKVEPKPQPSTLAPMPPALRAMVTATLKPVLQPKARQTRFPAVVVGVLSGNERYVTAYGKTGVQMPVDKTLFGAASVTKPVTALLLAKMVAAGDVKLDGAAVSCKPNPNLCPKGKPITWRHLVSHTSGLPTVPDDLQTVGKPKYGAKRLRDFLKRVKLISVPGAEFRYSTTGYAVLGNALARRRGKSFASLLRDEVLVPLGMKDAVLGLERKDAARLAIGHKNGKRLPMPAGSGALAPSGGLYCSAGDLLQFLQANMQPDAKWKKAMDLLLQVSKVKSVAGSKMALGWQQFTPAKFYWHGGFASGYTCFVTFHRATRSGVVVLTNAGTRPNDSRLARVSFGLLGQVMQKGWK